MSQESALSRRGFLKISGLLTGGLVVGAPLSGCSSSPAPIPFAQPEQLSANAFIQINNDGQVTFFVPNAEMGQGAQMGLSTLVAEELNLPPNRIQTQFAGSHEAYGMPGAGMQVTGGSATIQARFIPMRKAAAAVRELLLDAAAQQLQQPKTSLTLEDGYVMHADKSYPMGSFVDIAKTLPIPEEPPLKPADQFRWIGNPNTVRNDALKKVTGTANFGLDVDLPDAKVAAVKSSPILGGKVKSFKAEAAKASSGVIDIVEVYNGVAVVADTYWQARQALKKLTIEWDFKALELAEHSSTQFSQALEAGLDSDDDVKAESEGNVKKALKSATKTLSARYSVPYLAHATMEPMNCTVNIQGDTMDVFIPTQAPGMAKQVAHHFSGIDKKNIQIHTPFLGGGFGRRAGHDYLVQATQIAMATQRPIQLVWSREDDMQNDYYRPATMAEFTAGLNEQGTIEALNVKRSGPNMFPHVIEEVFDFMMPNAVPDFMANWLSKGTYGLFKHWTADPSSVEGLADDYAIPNKRVGTVTVDTGLRCGAWRSVGHSFSGFFAESFMDELATEVQIDPVEFRLRHLEDNPRLKKTLEIAKEKTGWPNASTKGRSLGVASHASFGTSVTEIAEVSVDNNAIKVHKVTCVVDCGLAVNPDIVKAQMESGIIFGLSAALHQQITLEKGKVKQDNFDNYPMLRLSETPEIEVVIVPSKEAPTGVGEPGTPPIAAAVANAVFHATGKRLRDLPLKLA